jgi:hypothetical protein
MAWKVASMGEMKPLAEETTLGPSHVWDDSY